MVYECSYVNGCFLSARVLNVYGVMQVADSGGALEVALSLYLENQARRTLGSREQLAKFAESSPKVRSDPFCPSLTSATSGLRKKN